MFPLSQVVYGEDEKKYRNVQGLTPENTVQLSHTPSSSFSSLSSSKISIHPSNTVYLEVLLLFSRPVFFPLRIFPNAG